MISVSNYGLYNPKFSSVTEVKRSEPMSATGPIPPLQAPAPESQKSDYNWRAVAILAGVSALALLGIAKGKSIAKMFKPKSREPFNNPNMKLVVNNVNPKHEYFPEDKIREAFEPEKLSDLMLKKDRINQKRYQRIMHIDQEGKILHKEEPLYEDMNAERMKANTGFRNRRCNYESIRPNPFRYSTRDAVDTAVDFAIFDDLVNGGKEIKQGYEFVKDVFKGGKSGSVVDDAMAGADDVVGGSSIGDFVSNLGERASDFMDDVFKGASDIADNIGDGLGDFADSLADIV